MRDVSQVRRVQDFFVCVWLLLSQQHCLLARQDETSAPKNPECRLFLPRILGGRLESRTPIMLCLSVWFLIQRR